MSLSQNVCELILGVNTPDPNLWIQNDSVKQPIKRNSVGSGNMSQIGTSAFNNHHDYRFIVHKKCTTSFLLENLAFEGTKSTCDISREFCVLHCFFSDAVLGDRFLRSGLSFCFRFECESNTSIIKSQRSSAGIPSIRNHASREIISASVAKISSTGCGELVASSCVVPQLLFPF